MTRQRVYNRLYQGWTIEEAVTLEKGKHRDISVEDSKNCVSDHLGNKYKSIGEMCAKYNITQATYRIRRNKGISTEECLLGKYKYIDKQGNKFRSMKEMADYWEIPLSTLRSRIYYLDMSLDDAVSRKKCRHKVYVDHTGNTFDTIKEMCSYWNIPLSTFQLRRNRGYSLKECLTYKKWERHCVRKYN